MAKVSPNPTCFCPVSRSSSRRRHRDLDRVACHAHWVDRDLELLAVTPGTVAHAKPPRVPGAGHDAVSERSRGQRRPHVRAQVVHGVVLGAVKKKGHEPASDFERAAFAGWDVADASDGRETQVVSHANRCTILLMNVPPVSSGIRLLVLDIDGTLTDSRHVVSDATCRAIQRVREAGVRVMLATGRRYRDALPIVEQLAITEPVVTASGGLVKRPGDHATLFRARFADGILPGVLEIVVAAGHEPVLYTDSFADGFDFYCRSLAGAVMPPAGGGFSEYLGRNCHLARVDPELERHPPADVFAGFVMGPREAMSALEGTLAAAYPDQLALHTIRSPRYSEWMCEIAPVGVSKWSGLAMVAASLGIAADAICAVGDDLNDLPMVQAAGLGIAMGNARAELLAAADRVVGTHDGSGIADVVDLVLAGLA